MEFPFFAIVNSEEETEAIARSFSTNLKNGTVVVLSGELGAGKTFFVKKTLSAFGINWVNSPTFAIVNEYSSSHKFYHIDFYRIKTVGELIEIGFEDYLNDETAIIFIEWGNLFPQILPRKRIEVTISIKHNSTREISITDV
ncbi:MAG: tRNA (adenosine(37)-N6)-threonylcarbamoyltransferase complex ATPase subunit type 1 TsaE [Ignavibacteriaceae bacterium]|nr:tRNA (adenosine(37)-N6)-threonylcarbamoyltransferase complex ATPase subunit type 1 TsaE [Ignavibacteriaceae bacterium]